MTGEIPDGPPDEVMLNVTAVAIGGRGLLICGEPGSGKSSLALALIDRGAILIGDDGISLRRNGESLMASPPPRQRGMIEVRNVGLVEMPCTSAPLKLVITLAKDAIHMPQAAGRRMLLGLSLPEIALFPDTFALPLRAEQALCLHGCK